MTADSDPRTDADDGAAAPPAGQGASSPDPAEGADDTPGKQPGSAKG